MMLFLDKKNLLEFRFVIVIKRHTFFLLNFIKGASAQPVCFDLNVYFCNIKRGYELFLLICKNER